MVVKWDLPPEPVPQWLDINEEITEANDTKPSNWKAATGMALQILFVEACFKALRNLGLTPEQAVEILSNSVVETGWGKFFRGWNLGGWKIRKSDVESLKSKGKKAKWWRAPGNKSSNDPPWCYYRGFDNLQEFFAEWIVKFVPKPGSEASVGRYKETGRLFWTGGDWFLALCKSGYKGEVTASNPKNSVDGHTQIVKIAKTILAQRTLGFVPDGIWGKESTAKALEFQKNKKIPETGKPDYGILEFYKIMP